MEDFKKKRFTIVAMTMRRVHAALGGRTPAERNHDEHVQQPHMVLGSGGS
jgi:hypothetical protein